MTSTLTTRGPTKATPRYVIDTWKDFLRTDLHLINNAADNGEATAEDVFNSLSPTIITAAETIDGRLDEIDKETARDLIQIIGFSLCTMERHAQKQGSSPGSCLSRLPGVAGLLEHLSKVGKHPAYLQHYGYWIWNRGPTPITFTGNIQEVLFLKAVNNTADLHTKSNDAIRPICTEDIDIESDTAIDALRFAADNTKSVHDDQYCALMKKNGDDRRALEPVFFMMKLRDNLVPCRIGKTVWSGPNAANHIAQMQQDFLSGTFSAVYFQAVVTKRMQYLTDEDREALVGDMMLSKTSVLHRFLARMKLTEPDVMANEPAIVASNIASQSDEFRNAMAAFIKFFEAISTLTAKHWAQIKIYLERASKSLTPEQVATLAVKPTHGTGGMSHADTERVMRMRVDHPTINKLKAAFLML